MRWINALFIFSLIGILGFVFLKRNQTHLPSGFPAKKEQKKLEINQIDSQDQALELPVQSKKIFKTKNQNPNPIKNQKKIETFEKNLTIDQMKLKDIESIEDFFIVENKNGLVFFQGDVLVGETNQSQERGLVERPEIQIWELPIHYEISSELSVSIQIEIKDAIEDLKRIGLDFIESNAEPKLRFTIFNDPNLCASYLGFRQSNQPIYLGKNCKKPQILHELLHAMGLIHEHSRIDRDEHIEIKSENIQENAFFQFQKFPGFDRFPYDVESILHYDGYSFSKNDKPTLVDKKGNPISMNFKLSETDILKLKTIYNLN